MESDPSPVVEFFSSSWVFVPLSVAGAIATFATLLRFMWPIGGLLVTKPKVRLEFTKTKGTSGPLLTCEFYNDPLSQWPFSFLNVKRQTIEEFWALARVIDMDRGGLVCELDTALHDRHGQHGDTFALPASAHNLSWPIVCFDDFGPCVFNENGIRTYLAPGTYEVRMFLHADEVDVRVVGQKFVVGIDPSVFAWVDSPYRINAAGLLRRLLTRLTPAAQAG